MLNYCDICFHDTCNSLNLYSAMCQLYINKTRAKKDHKKTVEKEEHSARQEYSLTNVCLINEWKGERSSEHLKLIFEGFVFSISMKHCFQ